MPETQYNSDKIENTTGCIQFNTLLFIEGLRPRSLLQLSSCVHSLSLSCSFPGEATSTGLTWLQLLKAHCCFQQSEAFWVYLVYMYCSSTKRVTVNTVICAGASFSFLEGSHRGNSFSYFFLSLFFLLKNVPISSLAACCVLDFKETISSICSVWWPPTFHNCYLSPSPADTHTNT